MQDVTDWAFWKIIASYGGPDIYFTEYFRVTQHYRLERSILRSIVDNPTGQPAIAQLIGNDPEAMVRAACQLEDYPVAAVDINLGCPAPVVYRKCAGGGLLREPQRLNALLAALRAGIRGRFTIKTRLGFSSPSEFPALLDIFAANSPDLVTVHSRTVTEKYGPITHPEAIRLAIRRLPCPIIANGNIFSPQSARSLWQDTGAHGLMIGRAAIRNPWIFRQIRESFANEAQFVPSGADVLKYIETLYSAYASPEVPEIQQVQKMKKYMNFLGEGVRPAFLHDIRRASTTSEFFAICRRDIPANSPMPLLPQTNSAEA